MLPNEDLHHEIMEVFNQYFKAHQLWISTQNSSSGVELRKELLRLKKLCDEQRMIIQDWRYVHFSPKQPSKRAIAMIQERNQKQLEGTLAPITKVKIKHRY